MGLKVNQSHTNVIAFALFVEFEIGSNLQADRRHVCVSTVLRRCWTDGPANAFEKIRAQDLNLDRQAGKD